MSNFKSGSGNLDFGGSDEDSNDSDPPESTTPTDTERVEDNEQGDHQSSGGSRDSSTTESDTPAEPAPSDANDSNESTSDTTAREQYPYFVRRSNVGDERDTRLEIHVRDKVADQEPAFRNELAEHLDVNEVSKTDAREFALLAAFENPERVAELLREEGFGTI